VRRVLADQTELNGKAHIKDVHMFGAHEIQQPLGLFFGDGKDALDRLVGELEHVGSMMCSRVADALSAINDSCATNAQFGDLMQQPVTYRLMAVLPVLLGIERQLIAVHAAPPPRSGHRLIHSSSWMSQYRFVRRNMT
jgi:hypothetical protein